MFTRSVYEAMKAIAPDYLFNAFLEVYAYDYGEKKVNEIGMKIRQTQHTEGYIVHIVQNFQKPTPKEILAVLNGVPFFLFSKAQTLCVGGLVIIYTWYGETRFGFEVANKYGDEFNFADDVAKLMADFIVECSNLKLNIGVNFFDMFWKKVIELYAEGSES